MLYSTISAVYTGLGFIFVPTKRRKTTDCPEHSVVLPTYHILSVMDKLYLEYRWPHICYREQFSK